MRIAYGTASDQWGELYLPVAEGRRGVVVVVHGGFWKAAYDASSFGTPLARDLAARGWTAWNVEYRRVGNGGGWPATFDDVSAAVDHLAELDVDTSRVVTVGHSAGGHLATWLGARTAARVAVTGVVAQAAVLDLAAAHRDNLGGGAVRNLLGGAPDEVPDRYALADPMRQVPLEVPVVCVHAPADDEVPFAQSEAYVAAATVAGARARLVRASGDHYTLVDPASADWQLCVDAVDELTA
ncbi:MAG TPA: alpha/beta fold hydrolase [Jatrophihabitantaceae bacterium]|nr:alpha/beta fold hydrolase [Jatrophihabitantaceae bacterium]